MPPHTLRTAPLGPHPSTHRRNLKRYELRLQFLLWTQGSPTKLSRLLQPESRVEFFPLHLRSPVRVALTSVPQCGARRSQRQRPANSEPRSLSLRAPCGQPRPLRRGASAPRNSAPQNYSTRRAAGRAAACRVTRPRREWRGAPGPPLPAPAGWFRRAPPGTERLLQPFLASRPPAPGGPRRPRVRDVGGLSGRLGAPGERQGPRCSRAEDVPRRRQEGRAAGAQRVPPAQPQGPRVLRPGRRRGPPEEHGASENHPLPGKGGASGTRVSEVAGSR